MSSSSTPESPSSFSKPPRSFLELVEGLRDDSKSSSSPSSSSIGLAAQAAAKASSIAALALDGVRKSFGQSRAAMCIVGEIFMKKLHRPGLSSCVSRQAHTDVMNVMTGLASAVRSLRPLPPSSTSEPLSKPSPPTSDFSSESSLKSPLSSTSEPLSKPSSPISDLSSKSSLNTPPSSISEQMPMSSSAPIVSPPRLCIYDPCCSI